MGFYLYTGNKLERLADQFREHVYVRPGAAWLTPETVVVQTQGMAAWLRLKLAESSPVAANLSFPFLNAFISSVFERVFPGYHDAVRNLSRERMTWRLFHIFMDHPEAYPELEKYFSHDTGAADLKKYQLAARIAGLFDQYQIYRGDVLNQWRTVSTPEQNWQARLFLELVGDGCGMDGYFRDFLARETLPAHAAPERVTVFGINAMASVYLQFFVKLAEFCDVHFFYMNPCEDYWSDVLSGRQASRLARRMGVDAGVFAGGNPLLASLGTRGRDFFSLMMEIPETSIAEENSCFEPFSAERTSMLGTIQQDVLENRRRGGSSSGKNFMPPLVHNSADHSIAIHNCHSALREVEVLHDQLLALLQDRRIQPRDIIVMAPDITVYEPYVNAVFGTGKLKNSYAFSDRSIRDSNRTAAAFLSLLKLRNSKYEISAVFDLLEHPALRRRWGLSDSDLNLMRQWVAASGIRWGVDAEHREELCGVRFEEYSWEQGLDRLLLGYAVLRDEAEQGREEVVSLDAVEGSDAETLGAFIRFVQALFSLRERLASARPLESWCELLLAVTDEFFLSDEDSYLELSAVRGTLRQLAEYGQELGLAEELSPELILSLLENGFGELNASESFLHGGITFCSLVPMRSIPMKVVAILGLRDGTFPRRDTAIGFSLLAREKRKLDPSPNLEDRYLFLESVLAARENLLLFYQGRDCRGDKEYPPASPLAELIDTLGASFHIAPEKLVIEHRLQAFEFDYFNGRNPELFSFSETNFMAAAALAKTLTGKGLSSCGVRESLPFCEVQSPPGEMSLRNLEEFFCAPQAYYLPQAAGLQYTDSARQPPEQENDEPLALNGLEKYVVGNSVMDWMQRGVPRGEQYHILKKTSRLPVGAAGEEAFLKEWETARKLPADFLQLWHSSQTVPLEVRLDDTLLAGDIPADPSGLTQIYCRNAKPTGADAVRWYLRHLLLSAVHGPAARSLTWNREKGVVLLMEGMSREESMARLRELLALYLRGCAAPLPLFKAASYAYASHRENLAEARKAFYTFIPPGSIRFGDWMEPAVALFFRPEDFDSPEFVSEFAELARIVHRPFLNGEVKDAS